MANDIIVHPGAGVLYSIWIVITTIAGVSVTALAIYWRKVGMKCALTKAGQEYPNEVVVEKRWVTKRPRRICELRFRSGLVVKYEISRGTEDAFQVKNS